MTDIYVGDYITNTEVEGPGKRFALWVSGCSFRCKGCCNPHLFNRDSSQIKSVEYMINEISKVKSEIEGVTFLGGEPLEQVEAVLEIMNFCKESGLSVMLFTGNTMDTIISNPELAKVIPLCDIIVDGQFDSSKIQRNRRWVGSENRNVNFITDRYSIEDGFLDNNEVTLKLVGSEIRMVGFPTFDLHKFLNS